MGGRSKESVQEAGSTTGLGARLLDGLERIALQLFLLRVHSPWATIAEAEGYAHVGHGVVKEAIRSGELTGYRRKGGRIVLVDLREVDGWIRSWAVVTVRERESEEAPQ